METVITLGVLGAITGLLHAYLWLRLVRGTTRRARWRWSGAVALGVAAIAMLGAVLAEPMGFWPPAWLAWPGFVWLGLMFLLFAALVVLELPVLAVRGWWRWRARGAQRAGRSRAVALAAVQPRDTAGPAAAAGANPGADPAAGSDPVGRVDPSAGSDPVAAADEAVDVGDRPDGSGTSRRLFLRRTAAAAAGAVAVGLGGYGIIRAFGPPEVRRVVAPLARLDRRADGLRIAVVADLHVGPLYGTGQVQRVVDMVNDLDADLVAIVGDMVSSEPGAVRGSTLPLRRLRARHGTFFVTGNHEYYTGHEEWIDVADDLGLRVLRNERVEIVHGGGAIDLAGVNDREGSRYDDPPDYHAALADRDASRPVVLLAHQPVQVHEAAAYGVDLQLSGHTHGGQVFPFHGLVRLDQPVLSGLAEVDGTLVYVTNGAGFWGPPMRVGAAPDVTLVELRST